ncbi:MAG: helix-turn-helix domain-containing protein [Candidatus Omnitrophica bacterium]|nr:helix-turn-helix domain-containing protein [Candidatus Omnitrophota bacterium]
MDNKKIFWDKNISDSEVRKILKDVTHPRFIYFVAALMSRTNDAKMVFREYLSRRDFVRHWQKIKRKMRQNDWNDSRILYWDEFYAVFRKGLKQNGKNDVKEKRSAINEELEKIGNKIRKARNKKNLTQRELAEKIGLSQQTVSFVERGYNNISFVTLQKITEALELNIYINVTDVPQSSVYGITSTSSY